MSLDPLHSSPKRSLRQVQARLSTPRLVAELFKKLYSERNVKTKRGLFQENSGLPTSRIAVRKTDLWGLTYIVNKESTPVYAAGSWS